MFWKRREAPRKLPRVAVCCMDSAETRAAVDALVHLGACDPVAILSDTPKDIAWFCRREKPDALLLEAVPDAMERFDDPDKDISGRCELSVRIAEVLPACRVYLICAEEFHHLEPVMQKAVETRLIHGYCFGKLTERQLKFWLGETPRPIIP